MRQAIEVFSWPRGDPESWRIAENGAWPHRAEIIYEKGLIFPFENAYRPLEEAPRLYADFAALGQVAEVAGRQIADEVEKRDGVRAWTETEDGKRTPLPQADPIRYADIVPGVRESTLDFVRSYGPLRVQLEWLVMDFLKEAVTLQHAMALAKAMRERERDWEGDAEGRKADAELSAMQFEMLKVRAGRLAGVRLIDHTDDTGRLAPAYSCTDLLSAIWLQFYEADSHGGAWRQCFGCGRLFVSTDARQRKHERVYHNAACRNRTHARLYGRKKGA